jgi:uncharacterized protein (TIGR02145 family)
MRHILFLGIAVLINLSPFACAQEKKKTVAVLEFNSTSRQIGKDELATLGNRFRTLLVKTNAFDVVEREKMSDILKEQNFILSDNCNSAECAVQVGQLLGVEFMIAGDIGKLGNIYSVDLRLIDVSSGKILQTENEDHDGEVGGLLKRMALIANSFAGIKDSAPSEKSNIMSESGAGIFTDPRDGKKYKTVKIGDQVWMAENLNFETSSGSFCYDNVPANCGRYGRLYDWENAKKFAPPGWHLPNNKEWETLVDYLGGFNEKTFPKLIAGGESGFNVLLTGWRGSLGNYEGLGTYIGLWTWCDDGTNLGWALHFLTENQSISLSEDGNEYSSYYVRCVKD